MLLGCSHGTWYGGFYANRKLLGNNILQDVTNWCAQWESILGGPWEINGVHIVVGVNNIPSVRPAVICMPFKGTFPDTFDV